MLIGSLVWLFFASLNAWMDGDNSMAWYVIGVVAFVLLASLVGSCS